MQDGPGIDVLSVQVMSPNTDITLTLFDALNGETTQTVCAGQNSVVSFDVSGESSQLILHVASPSGAGAVTLKIGKIQVPQTIDASTLPGVFQDVNGVATTTVATSGFGTSAGFSYAELPGTDDVTPATFTGFGSNLVAPPVVAEYEKVDGVMTLQGFSITPVGGDITYSRATVASAVEGVVAIQTSFAPSEAITLNSVGDAVVPVGVSMVPDLTETPPLRAILKITGIDFLTTFQQNYYETIVPNDITGDPAVTLLPSAGAGQARVTVYLRGVSIASFVNVNSGTTVFFLTGPLYRTGWMPGRRSSATIVGPSRLPAELSRSRQPPILVTPSPKPPRTTIRPL